LRRARLLGTVNWQTQFKTPLHGVLLPHLNDVRQLSNLLRAAALVEADTGNQLAAVEHCRDIVFLARSIQDEPFLVSHLVGTAIDSVGAITAKSIAGTLTAPDAQTRKAIEQLIAELLDETSLRRSAVYSIYGERAAQLDVVRYLAAGNSGRDIGMPFADSRPQAFLYWWYQPIFHEDAAVMLDHTSQQLPAVSASDYGTSRKLMPRDPVFKGANDIILRPLSRMMTPAFSRATGRHYSVQRERDRAAIELACAVYYADHGRYPARIEDLVPKHLPHVPGDPVNGGLMTIPTPTSQPAK
jgi:hypothetical protein